MRIKIDMNNKNRYKSKTIRIKLKKKYMYQSGIEWWNWKQIKLLQESQEEKFQIKRIRIEVEIL
jgi:hypothetical protein